MADAADARRRAEEYLRFWGHNESDGMEIMRALLARIVELESLLRECNAVCLCGCPDAEHEADECGEDCGHDDHECIRVAPAVLEIVQRYRVALSDALRAQTTPPPSDAVREAAEALTVYCHVCEADRREPCHAVTTGDPAPYPHPERAVAAALAARGGE